jgi:hypothetical protein
MDWSFGFHHSRDSDPLTRPVCAERLWLEKIKNSARKIIASSAQSSNSTG